MSAYPPPPPTGGPYNPYDRAARDAARAQYRAQQAAYRAQQRMQRAAWKAQRRAMRRSSIVGPLLLLTLGLFFLLMQLHRVSGMHAVDWFAHWWPVVLIGAGIILVAEWMLDRDRPVEAGGPRAIGGGVVFLLILLVVAGLGAQAAIHAVEWKHQTMGEGFGKLDEVLGNRSDEDDDVTSAIAATGVLVVRNPHGDVTVSGTSSDGQVHVSIHKHAFSWNESDVRHKMQQLQPVFAQEGKDLTLTVQGVAGGQADLTVTLPPSCGVTVNADHGDVEISGVQSAVAVSANHGDVQINDIKGDVQATINDDDAGITMHDIDGALTVQGHTGDIDISTVSGALTLQGDFYGTTHLKTVHGAVRFSSTRTQFQAARLDDEFSVESESLDASALVGPVVLKTTDKNITLDRVQGSVDVNDKNGEVHVTSASPLAAVTVNNSRGSVDVGVPPGSSFTVNAQTHNGDMENDFGISQQDSGEMHTMRGSEGGGGAKITINTTDGDVTLRKVTATPPALPAPPAPPSPSAKPPRISHVPQPPKSPDAPKAPSAVTF